MNTPAIRIENVEVVFPLGRQVARRRFAALHDLSLSIAHGDKLGVVGRNGSGKSTLLRLIAGTIAPDRGTIRRNHGRCQLLAIGAGFVNSLSGRDNAMLSMLLQGISFGRAAALLPAVQEFSELGDFFLAPTSTYSTGMRSRLGLAVALQLQPDILLLDEVLGVGDSSFKEKSRAAIRDRLRSDATVVLVSHDQGTIRAFCNRVAWIKDGRLEMEGSPAKVLRCYRQADGIQKDRPAVGASPEGSLSEPLPDVGGEHNRQ